MVKNINKHHTGKSLLTQQIIGSLPTEHSLSGKDHHPQHTLPLEASPSMSSRMGGPSILPVTWEVLENCLHLCFLSQLPPSPGAQPSVQAMT